MLDDKKLPGKSGPVHLKCDNLNFGKPKSGLLFDDQALDAMLLDLSRVDAEMEVGQRMQVRGKRNVSNVVSIRTKADMRR